MEGTGPFEVQTHNTVANLLLGGRLAGIAQISADSCLCATCLSGSAGFAYACMSVYEQTLVSFHMCSHPCLNTYVWVSKCVYVTVSSSCMYVFAFLCICLHACLSVFLVKLCVCAHTYVCVFWYCVVRYRVQEQVLLSVLQLLCALPSQLAQ